MGNFISIIRTTSTGGLLNVNRATITGVTGAASIGVYTCHAALTHADIATVANTGMLVLDRRSP